MKRHFSRIGLAILLCALGGAIHLLALRWSFFHELPGEPSTSFVNNIVVISIFVLVGGILYAVLFTGLVIKAVCQGGISRLTVLKGGLFGMLATTVALQARYLAMGSVLTHLARANYPPDRGESLFTAFLIGMLPVETYGLIEMIYALIPSFICGALVTIGVTYFTLSRNPPETDGTS